MSCSGARAVVALLLALALALVAASYGARAITCSDVYQELTPCLSYIQAGGGAVPEACCNGIRSLLSTAKTTVDRRTACGCLKTAATGVTGLNLTLVSSLPSKCGVSIPYKISPSTDCSKVH